MFLLRAAATSPMALPGWSSIILELKDLQIVKLIGTTKETIGKIRERTHWNIANITAKHPAMLGFVHTGRFGRRH